ncbi:hypothetical protein [Usitatibacter palustris]|uniref:Secreted protein n=1 Tax=Usitatibacter palustris TaxID=2732487 RepID=A0A6M4H7V2_9PROT|nr:hypothetical protein [Usitatibacter palustris]QJR15691.1 hypothetical protein DSM104440_02517 [Usitatibacter palustris]
MSQALRGGTLAIAALLAVATFNVSAGREGSGNRSSLNWDQPVCFLNGGTHAGFGTIRGYIWYGEGGVSKSFDTKEISYQGMEKFESQLCIVLKKGTTSHSIKVTVGAGVPTIGANPTACEVKLPLQPIANSDMSNLPPANTVLYVLGKGNAGNLHCEFCTATTTSYKMNRKDLTKCSSTLPAPRP